MKEERIKEVFAGEVRHWLPKAELVDQALATSENGFTVSALLKEVVFKGHPIDNVSSVSIGYTVIISQEWSDEDNIRQNFGGLLVKAREHVMEKVNAWSASEPA